MKCWYKPLYVQLTFENYFVFSNIVSNWSVSSAESSSEFVHVAVSNRGQTNIEWLTIWVCPLILPQAWESLTFFQFIVPFWLIVKHVLMHHAFLGWVDLVEFSNSSWRVRTCEQLGIKHVKFSFIKRVDKGRITPVRDWKADVSSVGPSSERQLGITSWLTS